MLQCGKELSWFGERGDLINANVENVGRVDFCNCVRIATALMMKGLSPGAAFVFLMTGPAINAVSITTIASLIGRRATFAYIAVIFFGAILFGTIINLLAGNIEALSVQCAACSTLPAFNHLAGIALALLMINACIRVPKMK